MDESAVNEREKQAKEIENAIAWLLDLSSRDGGISRKLANLLSVSAVKISFIRKSTVTPQAETLL